MCLCRRKCRSRHCARAACRSRNARAVRSKAHGAWTRRSVKDSSRRRLLQNRMRGVEVGRLLKGVTRTTQQGFGQMRPHELQAERHAVAVEATRQAECRAARAIEGP